MEIPLAKSPSCERSLWLKGVRLFAFQGTASSTPRSTILSLPSTEQECRAYRAWGWLTLQQPSGGRIYVQNLHPWLEWFHSPPLQTAWKSSSPFREQSHPHCTLRFCPCPQPSRAYRAWGWLTLQQPSGGRIYVQNLHPWLLNGFTPHLRLLGNPSREFAPLRKVPSSSALVRLSGNRVIHTTLYRRFCPTILSLPNPTYRMHTKAFHLQKNRSLPRHRRN